MRNRGVAQALKDRPAAKDARPKFGNGLKSGNYHRSLRIVGKFGLAHQLHFVKRIALS
jgi:hypothetical protein